LVVESTKLGLSEQLEKSLPGMQKKLFLGPKMCFILVDGTEAKQVEP